MMALLQPEGIGNMYSGRAPLVQAIVRDTDCMCMRVVSIFTRLAAQHLPSPEASLHEETLHHVHCRPRCIEVCRPGVVVPGAC
jgi:hypothetical protein